MCSLLAHRKITQGLKIKEGVCHKATGDPTDNTLSPASKVAEKRKAAKPHGRRLGLRDLVERPLLPCRRGSTFGTTSCAGPPCLCYCALLLYCTPQPILLYCCRALLLYCSTAAVPHCSALLQRPTAPLVLWCCCCVLLLYCSTAAALYCSTALLLLCSTALSTALPCTVFPSTWRRRRSAALSSVMCNGDRNGCGNGNFREDNSSNFGSDSRA